LFRFKNDCDENICEKLKEHKDDIQFFKYFDWRLAKVDIVDNQISLWQLLIEWERGNNVVQNIVPIVPQLNLVDLMV
jgi:hypothetical protein